MGKLKVLHISFNSDIVFFLRASSVKAGTWAFFIWISDEGAEECVYSFLLLVERSLVSRVAADRFDMIQQEKDQSKSVGLDA